jgi:DNA-binding protein H-NS
MAKSPQAQPAREAPRDLAAYSFAQLLNLKKEVDGEVEARKSKEIDALRAKITESAQNLGVSIHELFGLEQAGKRETKHARGKQPAKYRGPAGEEWSGRGPAPRWMKAFLAKGKSKADFLIK